MSCCSNQNNECMSFEVRKACADDIPCIHGMIQELANFENVPDGPKLSIEDLLRDGGFMNCGDQAQYQAFIAEAVYNNGNRKPIGYVMAYFSYSTWIGRSLHLEDLYVQPSYRYKGIGRLFVQKVAEFARDEGAGRIDLDCLNWNPASEFYKKLGANDITVDGDWHKYRFNGDDIHRLADS